MENPMGMEWERVEGFVKHEFAPPEATKDTEWDMDASLIFTLQAIRMRATKRYGDAKVIIHKNGGFALSGHADNSLHYVGKAVDFHINVPHGTLNPIRQALLIYELTDFRYGLGLYTWGCHLDFRAGVDDRTDAVWHYKDGLYHFERHNRFYRTTVNAGLSEEFIALQADTV